VRENVPQIIRDRIAYRNNRRNHRAAAEADASRRSRQTTTGPLPTNDEAAPAA